MARPFRRGQFTPIFFLVAAASLVLAFLGYRASRAVDAADDQQRAAASRREAESLVDRVESSIIDTENVVFHLLDVDAEVAYEPWEDVVHTFPLARSALLVDRSGAVRMFASRRAGPSLAAFEASFRERVVPAIPFAELEDNVGSLKHLHLGGPDDRYSLFSIVPRLTGGELLFTVLEVDMDDVVGDIFVKTFAGPARTLRLAVVDDSERALYGAPLAALGPFGAELRFPTTLYRWRLRLEPPVATRAWWEDRLTIAALSIAIALGVILSGLLALAVAVRRARRYAALQAEFVSNVSHELRTPLSLIRMFGELLALGKVRDRDRELEYSRIITRESERLSFLIDNVLDFSRLERGEKGFALGTVRLADVVQGALDAFRPRLERDGPRLVAAIAPDAAAREVKGDANALTLALLNLLDNAVKYGAGQGAVTVSLRRDGAALVLAVRDEGPGIPAEYLDQVFDRFFRVPAEPGRKAVRGSGIGLSLVKAIATHHGARVAARSTVGEGSEFSLVFPLPRGEPSAPAAPAALPAPAEASRG
ncbi:MAG TPA: HAMP domain-containing sensor histidine kinase [Myxococcota bacterium]|jgi:two-component system phosphate regulon sensor histidine kinase PhoR|nr:HAMP domain-containing sensor histidine kinase [Myxococcota bacterium]